MTVWRCGPHVLDLSRGPLCMGILNVTPDSFSDGYAELGEALAQADRMVREGADLIDVGGESTRPGSDPVTQETELARVLPVVEKLSKSLTVPLSIDTRRPEVARRALAAGASIVNHVSATLDHGPMLEAVRNTGAGYVAMHMRDLPKTMQRAPQYGSVVDEVLESLASVGNAALAAGISQDRMIFDPGIGFGKDLDHNLTLMRSFDRMAASLGRPMMAGVSRKSWLNRMFGVSKARDDLAERDAYTLVVGVLLPFPAVAVHRVHNVGWWRNAMKLKQALTTPFEHGT